MHSDLILVLQPWTETPAGTPTPSYHVLERESPRSEVFPLSLILLMVLTQMGVLQGASLSKIKIFLFLVKVSPRFGIRLQIEHHSCFFSVFFFETGSVSAN